MTRYVNSVAILSSNGRYEKTLKKRYYEELQNLERERNLSLYLPQYMNNYVIPVKEDYLYSDILKDYGKGRISAGLKSLNLLSILASGVESKDLFLFTNVIYAGSVHEFLEASDERLFQLILENLGMQIFKNYVTNEYKTVCIQVGKHVRDGTLNYKSYKGFFLRESKKIVNKFLGLT